MYVAHNSNSLTTNRYKSLTSSPIKKSNKKRSSPTQSASILNGLGRSSTSATMKSSIGDFGGIVGGGVGVGGRLQAFHDTMNNVVVGDTGVNVNNAGGMDGQSLREFVGTNNQAPQSTSTYQSSNTTVVKKRPIARSIGITASTITPGKFDLLYAEESPDFCIPSERYNIKGTKGRLCSESPNVSNSCERLCCGRGYKTEIREEKYRCECKFQFCCKLQCNTCTRRKIIHKCL